MLYDVLCYTEQVWILIRLVALICAQISDFVGQLKHEILIKIKKAIIDFNEATSIITSTGTITITKPRTKGLEKRKQWWTRAKRLPLKTRISYDKHK